MDKIKIGSTVQVKFDDGDLETFRLVASYEADVFNNKVSADSPFGKAVIGKRVGQDIRYIVMPDKSIQCKIIKIGQH